MDQVRVLPTLSHRCLLVGQVELGVKQPIPEVDTFRYFMKVTGSHPIRHLRMTGVLPAGRSSLGFIAPLGLPRPSPLGTQAVGQPHTLSSLISHSPSPQKAQSSAVFFNTELMRSIFYPLQGGGCGVEVGSANWWWMNHPTALY